MKFSKYQLKKEISILKNLDHCNIVKYYDNLNNFREFVQVIVMEYCNKGSLYDFIELHQGLCDNMFLKMLECLNKGISYLRSKALVHRDIKPGNMMVHEDSMGYFHVKVGDMGTAKKVEDHQTFPSLVGTEEYLHPDMYIRYLEGIDSQNHHHRANVDLWSIGVTLYHAVVTELPFLPFNYSRYNDRAKDTLKFMYENKKPGVISGRQNSYDRSDITWSEMLPDKCRLSKMIKEMASKLIANLMDRNADNTYDRFFKESDIIIQKKRALMFNSLTGQLQYLYLDNLTYNNFVEVISANTGLHHGDFIMFTKTSRLEQMSDVHGECIETIPIKGHLRYELTDNTILVIITKLIDTQPMDSRFLDITGNCEGPCIRYKNFKDMTTYSDKLMKAIYQIASATNYIDCQVSCYKAIVTAFNEHIMIDQLRLMNEALPWQMKSIRDTSLMTESLVNITGLAIVNSEAGATNQDSLIKCKAEIEQLRQKATEGEKCGEQYFLKIVERREMVKYSRRCFESNESKIAEYGDSLNHLVHLAEELVSEVKLVPDERHSADEPYKLEIWQRHTRQFKIYQTAKEKYVGKVENIKEMHKAFYNWLKQALSVMNRITLLRDFLKRQEERRSSLRSKFLQVDEFVEKVLSSSNFGDKMKDIPALVVSENEQIKSAILEVQKLTEKTKNRFYQQM